MNDVRESSKVQWLDGPDRLPESMTVAAMRRLAAIALSIVTFARLLFLYVGVPCIAIVILIAVPAALGMHPFAVGVIFSIGIGVGLAIYYDSFLDR